MSDLHTVLYEKNWPQEAKIIRSAVFEKEQGFVDEFDGTDDIATHFVVFDGKMPVATCRVFPQTANDGHSGVYLLGRFAVLREYRMQHVGALMLKETEKYVKEIGGRSMRLHAQFQAVGFYEKQGYVRISDIDKEQGCPHVWLEKCM